MGYYSATEKTYLPSENRVGGFDPSCLTYAGESSLQVVEVHQENEGRGTTLALGVTYYGYRYYNPSTGRFLSKDPIEEFGGLNLYGYANNDPINGYDVLGLYRKSFNCNQAQEAAIKQAEKTVDASIQETKRLLSNTFTETDFVENYLLKLSGARPLGIMIAFRNWHRKLNTTLNKVDSGLKKNDYDVECCLCEAKKVSEAYAWVPRSKIVKAIDNTIYFCPAFFEEEHTADDQAKTFLHEGSHFFANTIHSPTTHGAPWGKNAKDAHWVEGLAVDPESYIKNFLKTFSRLYQQ